MRVFVGKAHALLDQQKQHIQTILEDHHDVSQRRIKQWCGDATATADESMQSKLVAFAYSDGGTPEPEAVAFFTLRMGRAALSVLHLVASRRAAPGGVNVVKLVRHVIARLGSRTGLLALVPSDHPDTEALLADAGLSGICAPEGVEPASSSLYAGELQSKTWKWLSSNVTEGDEKIETFFAAAQVPAALGPVPVPSPSPSRADRSRRSAGAPEVLPANENVPKVGQLMALYQLHDRQHYMARVIRLEKRMVAGGDVHGFVENDVSYQWLEDGGEVGSVMGNSLIRVGPKQAKRREEMEPRGKPQMAEYANKKGNCRLYRRRAL